MPSPQQTPNNVTSVDDMLDEIPPSAVINHQHQVNNSDSEESFKSVENFVPIKLKFIRKFAKVSGKIARDELEELLLQKVTESMVYRTKYAEIRVKLDIYEELCQRQRSRIELLEKQYADLEVTHERILTAMRENPQDPIEPLKIVRAVSCQVYQQSAEYVNSMPNPIVIGDSPRKRRQQEENSRKKASSTGRSRDKGLRSNTKQSSMSNQVQTKSTETQIESNPNTSKTDPNPSKSRNQKTMSSSKNNQNSDKISSSSESSSVGNPEKRGRKRKATTIWDMLQKKVRNSVEGPSSKCSNTSVQDLKENEGKDSDSNNDVTLIEDDDEEPKPRGQKRSVRTSYHDLELSRVVEKLAKATNLTKLNSKTTNSESERSSQGLTSKSKKVEQKSGNKTSKQDNLTTKIPEKSRNDNITSKSSSSTSNQSISLESNAGSPESVLSSSPEPEAPIPVQKSFKVPTTKPKATRPGPKCSKLSNQVKKNGIKSSEGSKKLNGSNSIENMIKHPQNVARNLQHGDSSSSNSHNNPPSAIKIPPSPFSSAKKSSNHDQSFDSLNFSSCSSLGAFSSFKPSANLVTSTPLKAVDKGPAPAVKRTLDLNFNSITKVPKLPLRGPQLIHPSLKPSIPAPSIKVEKVNNGIRISWRIDNFKATDHADVQSYQIYAYEEMPGSGQTSSDDWKLVGDVKALLLPMAVTLREFNEDQKFHFAIRAVDVHERLGEFSEPRTWE